MPKNFERTESKSWWQVDGGNILDANYLNLFKMDKIKYKFLDAIH